MNTKIILASLALVITSAFSSASFAQSGTISFTGRIVAPACTGSIAANSTANNALDTLSLGQCANSNTQVVRTSITSSNSNSTTEHNTDSAIVTVSYE